MLTSKYTVVARGFPAAWCVAPILVLNFFFLRRYTADVFGAYDHLKWAGGATFSVMLMYLLAQAGRFVGKELFERQQFQDGRAFPSTVTLLPSDSTYSPAYKQQLRAKIRRDFGDNLPSATDELADGTAVRRRIGEIVSRIRARVQDGRLLLQHNIEYGMARNFVGGSLLSAYVSTANMYIFSLCIPNVIAFRVSLGLALGYTSVLVCSRPILQRYSANYARILLQEYLASP
ncbi:MAG: hypothetical protein HY084_11905 [Gemmatimonadetes bacterium]|nr:hypothetical protein [Gemmatimonadota bacterium]